MQTFAKTGQAVCTLKILSPSCLSQRCVSVFLAECIVHLQLLQAYPARSFWQTGLGWFPGGGHHWSEHPDDHRHFSHASQQTHRHAHPLCGAASE